MSYKNASAPITANNMAAKGKSKTLNTDFIFDIELNILGEKIILAFTAVMVKRMMGYRELFRIDFMVSFYGII